MSRAYKIAVSVVSLLFLSVLRYVNDYVAETLTQTMQLFIYLSLLFAGGAVAASFLSLFESSATTKNSAISRIAKSISEDPSRNFFIGFLITAYMIFVRPRLVFGMTFLPYVEWVTIAFGVYKMYSVIGLSNRQFYMHSEQIGWKMHIQEVKRETGGDLSRLTSAMEEFVERGVKEPLIVSLVLHLQRLGTTEEDILMTLSPLVNYQEAHFHKLLFISFPWAKRKNTERSREARRKLLDNLLEGIGRCSQNESEER